MARSFHLLLMVAVLSVLVTESFPAAGGLGMNWGTMATHPLPPGIAVRALQDNGIRKVKLFDADADTMGALAGSGIEVMVAIPNNLLAVVAADYGAARGWVNRNVSRYRFAGGVDVRYVAVGNKPFLSSYNGTFLNVTLPALQNIQRALDKAGIGGAIKATVSLNADVYNSQAGNPVPSAGRFRADIAGFMAQQVQFLSQSARRGAPAWKRRAAAAGPRRRWRPQPGGGREGGGARGKEGGRSREGEGGRPRQGPGRGKEGGRARRQGEGGRRRQGPGDEESSACP